MIIFIVPLIIFYNSGVVLYIITYYNILVSYIMILPSYANSPALPIRLLNNKLKQYHFHERNNNNHFTYPIERHICHV